MNDDAIRVSLSEAAGSGARRLGPSVGTPVTGTGSPDLAPEPSGQLAARYRVIDELGRGQMGIVYRAVQTALGREVAIKFPTVETEVGAERFLREARLLAGLAHPNLVRVLDADLDGGRPFLVLEFVTGYSLMEYRERRKTLGVPESVGLVCQVLDGLAEAHAAGIVHRDIKAGNVLVSKDGVAKLADFGLARGADTNALTEQGTLLGTPAYLAPEVCQGKPATPASDLYAVGILLFELLTGRLPFTALSPGELLGKHIRDAPPRLARFADEITDELEAVYQKLLAKAPENRPRDAHEVGRSLRLAMGLSGSVTALAIPALPPEAVAEVPQAQPPPPGSRPGRKTASRTIPVPPPPESPTWVFALGGFAVALAMAAPAAWFLTRKPAPIPVPSLAAAAAAPSSPGNQPPSPIPRWAPLKRLTRDRTNADRWVSTTDDAEMVRVPGGPAVRGASEIGPDEKPVRVIHVDELWIDRYEVTNRQYDRFTAATRRTPRERHTGAHAALDRPDHPVIGVTWQDAVDYCAWAGKRLPTEAEWEKAARGPEGLRYPWGNDDRGQNLPANIADPMGLSPDGFELTAPVGRFPAGASPYGALDMSGNVWEWCSDWYGDTYYATSPDRNPTGPDTGRWRASRGASHMTYLPNDMLSAYRKRGEPGARHLDQGFRCLRPGPN